MEIDNTKLKVKAFELQYLNKTIRFCTEKLLSGKWNNKNVTTYYGYNGIDSVGSNIVAQKVANIVAHCNLKCIETENADIIRQSITVNPSQY